MRIAALKKDGSLLVDMQNIQDEMPCLCLAAVEQDGLNLKHVKKQTQEVCRAAVAQNPDAIYYVIDKSMLD
jgi:hypothetical protein